MKLTMKLTLLSIIAVATLASCNTTIGLGRDMRVLGTEMEKKADETYNGPSGTSDGYSDPATDYSGGAPVY
jgi:predicted small secreted protein